MESTVLITGGTGYIGSWIVKGLLESGYTVRMTVRNKANSEKYEHLKKLAEASTGNLEVYEADLLKDGAFDDPAQGAEAILHVASPFMIRVKDPEKELVNPALQGTVNVLQAANKSSTVKKVVLTSSVAAICGDNIDMMNQGLERLTEEHHNTSSSLHHQPYPYSKTVAEKAAWDVANAQDRWQLVTINPGFVLGPTLTAHSGSESLKMVRDMMAGTFKMGVPNLEFAMVDVRDVADAHIKALENDDAEGRHIVADKSASMLDMANLVEKTSPGKYKLPKKENPKWFMMMIGWMFGVKRRWIKLNVGYPIRFDNTKSREQLGVTYRPFSETMHDMVKSLEAK